MAESWARIKSNLGLESPELQPAGGPRLSSSVSTGKEQKPFESRHEGENGQGEERERGQSKRTDEEGRPGVIERPESVFEKRYVPKRGSVEFEKLQRKYSSELDRLEEVQKNGSPFGKGKWNMGEGGYDTRGKPEKLRPTVIGEFLGKDKKWHPIILCLGTQKTKFPAGSGNGLRHIEFRHGKQIRDLGYEDVVDYLQIILRSSSKELDHAGHKSLNLFDLKKDREDVMALKKDSSGGYTVHTAFPANPGYLEHAIKASEKALETGTARDSLEEGYSAPDFRAAQLFSKVKRSGGRPYYAFLDSPSARYVHVPSLQRLKTLMAAPQESAG